MLRNRNRIIKGMLLVVVVLTSGEYARWAVQGWMMFGHERPYANRALITFLAQILIALGMGPEPALIVVMVATAIGLVYGIKYLLGSFRK